MLIQSVRPNQSKNNPFKEFFQMNEEENTILKNSFTLFSNKFFDNIIGEEEFKETALDTKIDKQLSEKKELKRKKSIYISSNEIKEINLEQSLKDIGVLTSETEEHLTLRKLPKISEEKLNEIKNNIINKDTFAQLY